MAEMIDSSIDPEFHEIIKKHSSQKQQITQLQTENRELRQLVESLRQQLAAATSHAPPPESPQSSVATQPLHSSPSFPPSSLTDSSLPPPNQRITRSQTKQGSLSSPPSPSLHRQESQSTADRLLHALSQEEKQLQIKEEDVSGGKRKRKMSVAQRTQAEKRAAREEVKDSAESADSIIARAVEERERGRSLKDTEPQQAQEHYQQSLHILSSLPPHSAVSEQARDAYAQAYHALGVLSSRQGKLQEARDYLRQVIEHRPDWWKGWKGLGSVEHSLRNYEEAVRAFDRALQCVMEEKERQTIENMRRVSQQEIRGSSRERLLHTPQSTLPFVLSPAHTPPRPTSHSPSSSPRPSANLNSRLDNADKGSRAVLGDITNLSSTPPASTGHAVLSKLNANNLAALQRLPMMSKEGIKDLLGAELFGHAGTLYEKDMIKEWKADGMTLLGRIVEVQKGARNEIRKRTVEARATFDNDRCIEYRCQCMLGRELVGEGGKEADRLPQEKIPVKGSSDRAWRYGACQHIGALLLRINELQKALDSPPSRTLYVHASHRPSAAQLAAEVAAYARYEKMTVEQMKALLKRNGTKTTGLKAELISRCVEGEVWGVAERCEECKMGYMYYSDGVWRCRGWFDVEKRMPVRCEHITLNVQMKPFVS